MAIRRRNKVLDPIVKLYAAAVDTSFVLMDDNAHPHRTAIVEDFLENEEIMSMEWPACSNNLNSIKIFGMLSALLYVESYPF